MTELEHPDQAEQKPDLTVVSLGGGIQSTALCLMAERGMFHAKPDVAIFADTKWEPPHVYETVQALQALLSFPVDVVSQDGRNLRDDVYNNVQSDGRAGFISIPVFIRNHQTGKLGMSSRQCTNRYKIYPIAQHIRKLLGLAKHKNVKPGTIVEQWFGISYDEVGRMSDPYKPYIRNIYPLIDHRLTRQDCLLWMTKHYPQVPVGKSACFGCPYHSSRTWNDLAVQYPDLMTETQALDNHIRNHSDVGETFLHASGLPLEQAIQATGQQSSLLDDDGLYGAECSGYCFG